MAFDVTSVKTAVGCCNGQINWTYSNADGSISGRTPITAEQMAVVNPATHTPGDLDTWLSTNCGNTTEELDTAITMHNTRAADAAAQNTYDNDGGTFVVEPS